MVHLLLAIAPKALVEPEVVATSPYPGKSRVPVCCGFDSLKLVLAAGLAPALATFSTSCLCIGLRELQAQGHKEWSLQPVLLRQECASQALRIGFPKRDCSLSRTAIFTKEIRRLLHGGKVAGMLMPRSLRCCPGHSGLMKPT